MRNLFNVLKEVMENEVDVVSGDKGIDADILPQGRALVFGHNRVRLLDSAFCVRDRKCRMRMCLPGIVTGMVPDGLYTCFGENQIKPYPPVFRAGFLPKI